MRRLFSVTILSFAFLMAACNKDKTLPDVNGKTIVGQWVHVEDYSSIGGPGSWQPATDGRVITIEADGKYRSSPNADMLGTNNEITLVNDSTITWFATVSSSGTPEKINITSGGNFRLSEDGNSFILWNMLCIEGCGSKYKRAMIF